MNNEDLTKLARWVIPGWLSLFSFYVFIVIDTAFSGPTQPHLYSSLHALFMDMSEINTVLVSFLIAAGGVPLGFVIYQTYFFLRWNSPYSRDGFLALIPGRMQDLRQSLLDLDESDIALGERWRERITQHPLFFIDHSFRWRYIELLFMEAVQALDRPGASIGLYARHRYLHEVVHVLGASIGAIYFGFGGYIFLKYYREGVSLLWYLFFTSVLILLLMYLMDRENRFREALSLQAEFEEHERKLLIEERWPLSILFPDKKISFAYPSSFLLISLVFIHFFANPSIAPTNSTVGDLIFKLYIMAITSVLWVVVSSKSNKKSIIRGSVIESGIGLGSAIALRIFQSYIDWPFVTSLSVFLWLNLVLFQNRHNAKGDMLALEYQTLRRYIILKEKNKEKNHE